MDERQLAVSLNIEWPGPKVLTERFVGRRCLYLTETAPALQTGSVSILAVDPGQTCGWAALHYDGTLEMGECSQSALCGQSLWYRPNLGALVVEQPPHGVVRAFEPEVYFCFGVLRFLYPDLHAQPVAALKPARKWVRVKTQRVSTHARDALSHLAYYVVMQSTTQQAPGG